MAYCSSVKNSYTVNLAGAVSLLDAEKRVIAKSNDQDNCLGAKQACALFTGFPAICKKKTCCFIPHTVRVIASM